jgi:hypothetical protein
MVYFSSHLVDRKYYHRIYACAIGTAGIVYKLMPVLKWSFRSLAGSLPIVSHRHAQKRILDIQ